MTGDMRHPAGTGRTQGLAARQTMGACARPLALYRHWYVVLPLAQWTTDSRRRMRHQVCDLRQDRGDGLPRAGHQQDAVQGGA
jgi:hypothetical protein